MVNNHSLVIAPPTASGSSQPLPNAPPGTLRSYNKRETGSKLIESFWFDLES